MQSIFEENNGNYGYRRINLALKNESIIVNHKKIQLIMKKFPCKSRRYSSYKGTVVTVAKNLLHRRFYTNPAYQKLTTDITEFKCLDVFKLYLNPIMDIYNGEIISYRINMHQHLT
ncbi:IS3 family transposase [Sporosarcina siberiensis]|uniref:IS3 family transposase n=1 Tax=Sporosarcina siberiensis TaxID=1365606 RepID=A0ABW4SAL8_9BACL